MGGGHKLFYLLLNCTVFRGAYIVLCLYFFLNKLKKT